MATLWPRFNAVLLMLVLGALVTTIAMLATGARGGPLDPQGTPGPTDSVRLPGTPISSVPFVITASGHYYLTRNLDYTGTGSAISFAEHLDNVTLDLGGFTLTGSFDGTGIRALGPTTPSQFPLQISNGYVRHFQTGVNTELAAHVRIDAVHALYNTGNGFKLGHHAVLSNCTSANNLDGIQLGGSLSRIQDCYIVDNSGSGVYNQGFDNVIEDSHFARNNTTAAAGHGEIRFGLGTKRVVVRNSVITGTGNTGFPFVHETTDLSYALVDNVMCGAPPVHNFVVSSGNVTGAFCQ